MLKVIWMVALIGIFTIQHALSAKEFCYNKEENPYRHYITKTKYRIKVLGDIRDEGGFGQISGCTPSVFYMIARHGSRYLKKSKIELLSKRLPELQNHLEQLQETHLCKEDFDAIRNWSMRMIPQNDQIMVEEGWTELKEIASRYKEIYPNLLGNAYDEEKMEFLHSYTASNRTKDSAYAFAKGLFGSHDNVRTKEIPPKDDWLMKFYANCDKYQTEIARKPIIEKEKFASGPEIKEVLRNIEFKLSLSEGSLTIEDLEILYDACSFEYAVYNDAPWCALFFKFDLKVIEYFNDIRYYWNDMYGHELNYEITCKLLEDALNSISLDKNETPEKTIITRFGHSGTLNAFFARLGLYNDSKTFTAEEYLENKNRKLKTSEICPMASNIVFVLHQCGNESEDQVSVFVNEELTDLPLDGCQYGVCPIRALKGAWQAHVDDCHLTEKCALTSSINNSAQIAHSFAALLLFWIFKAFY